MKFKVIAASTAKGAAVLVDSVASAKLGTAEHPSGVALVIYESKDGYPGADVSKVLREIADFIDKGGHPVHDITPVIPEASA